MFGDEPVKKSDIHELGADLSAFSVGELEKRIDMLKAEILRVETVLSEKRASLASAENFFKR